MNKYFMKFLLFELEIVKISYSRFRDGQLQGLAKMWTFRKHDIITLYVSGRHMEANPPVWHFTTCDTQHSQFCPCSHTI